MAAGVLFDVDVDGVLIDSALMYRDMWAAWAVMRAVDREAMFRGIHGERGVDTILRVAPHLDAEAELAVLAELIVDHEHKAGAFPAAASLLAATSGRNGLVTSGPRAGTLARFARLGLPVPEVVVCGEDVTHGKPHPEPFLRGCELLGIEPADCVAVEDAPAGIAAAEAAGCYVLAVTTSVPERECAAADEVCSDLVAAAARVAALLQL